MYTFIVGGLVDDQSDALADDFLSDSIEFSSILCSRARKIGRWNGCKLELKRLNERATYRRLLHIYVGSLYRMECEMIGPSILVGCLLRPAVVLSDILWLL